MPTACHGLRVIHIFIRTAFVVLALFIISLFTECRSSTEKNQMSEGVIEYDIHYVNNSGRNFPIQLLPKVMYFTFNRNFAEYSIEDRVGLFAIKIITDLKSHQHLTLIKVFDKKCVYKDNGKETPVFFKPDIHYKFTKTTPDTLRIGGMLCYKTILTDPETSLSVPVAYTLADIKNPNYNTPYEAVNGILMEFNLQMKSLDMKLEAKKIEHKVIDDKEFEVPGSYKAISRTRMEEIITTLLP